MRNVARPRRSTRRRATWFLAPAVLVLGACSDDGPDAGRFCGEVEANRVALTAPRIEFADDIEPFLALYRSVGELAPLAIEDEWGRLVENYETASTVVPGDPESEQRVITTALQSEEAATEVDAWLRENCGIDLGPLSTLVPIDT